MEEKLSKDSSLDEIFRLLSDEKKGVRVGDNVFLRMTYPNCFKGSEVEEWLLANLSNVTSKEAYSVAQKLVKLFFFSLLFLILDKSLKRVI